MSVKPSYVRHRPPGEFTVTGDRPPLTCLAEIEDHLRELRAQMLRRGTSDPCTDLVREHRDLVRERNRIREGRATWQR